MLCAWLASLRDWKTGEYSSHPPPVFDLNLHNSSYDHAVVIVHTHSDDDTGALWFCSEPKSGGPASTPIDCVCVFLTWV